MLLKSWISESEKQDSIFIIDEVLYFGGILHYQESTALDKYINTENLFSIPLSYIRVITINQHKNIIEIVYGGKSETSIKLSNPILQKEFIAFFIDLYPKSVVLKHDKFALTKSSTKNLMGIVVIIISYLFVLFEIYSDQTTNGHISSIQLLIKTIAQLGILKTSLIFSSLLIIAGFNLYKKLKNSNKITVIEIER